MTALAPLSTEEILRGWVEFHCPAHGGQVATIPTASVKCRCGKWCRRERHGRVLRKADIKALQIAGSESLRAA